MMKFRLNAVFSTYVDMMWAYVDKKSAVAFFDWTLDSILIDLNSLPGTPHTNPGTPTKTPLSGIPPVQQRSSEIPHRLRKDTGYSPNHRQPEWLMQVLPVPDSGIANAGF